MSENKNDNNSSFMSDLAEFVIDSFKSSIKDYTEEIKASVEYSEWGDKDKSSECCDVCKDIAEEYNFLWNSVKRVIFDVQDGGMSAKELGETFGSTSIQDIFKFHKVNEFVDRMRKYEKAHRESTVKKREKLKVGDEVVDKNGKNYVICEVTDQSAKATNFKTYENYFDIYDVKARTGRRFPEIGGLIEKLRDYQK